MRSLSLGIVAIAPVHLLLCDWITSFDASAKCTSVS
jgi:hypothetical protein